MRSFAQAQPSAVRSSPQEIAFPTGQAELSTPEFRATHKAVSAGAAWGLHGGSLHVEGQGLLRCTSLTFSLCPCLTAAPRRRPAHVPG